MAHTMQVVAEAHPDRAWVQLDVANAFPSVSRQAVLDALTEHAPELLPMVEMFWRRALSFAFQDASGHGVEMRATLGVEPGDVLGAATLRGGLPAAPRGASRSTPHPP